MGNDSFTEVTSQSWFGRIGGAFKGILVGIVLVIIAFPLLFWNEGRAVKRYKTLKEGGGAVISVPSDRIDASNDGKLIHVAGKASTGEILTDSEFNVSAIAIKLRRVVEMYQWQQESRSEQKKKLGGGTETTTTYTYSKKWSDSLINSQNFKQPEGHQNPGQMPYQSEEQVAGTVTLGAFTLSPSLVSKIHSYTPVTLADDSILPEGLENASVASDTVYIGQAPANPQIGDVRISFQEVRPKDISIVAKQMGKTFEPYSTRAGGAIELLQTGIHSAEAMFEQAQKSNTILTWVLRLVGFIVMLIGFSLIFAPLAVFADVLPILGSIVSVGTGFIAALVAGILSFLTIAVAWFVYRPVLSIILIIIAGGIGFILFKKLRKADPVKAASIPPPPPPPAGS